MIHALIRTRQDRIQESWEIRPCFICHLLGRCKHREYDVELALVDAELRRAQQDEKVTPMKRRHA